MKFRKQNFRVIAMRFSAATVSLWAIIGCGASAPTKPSVLFYLVDDLGHYNVHFGGSVDPHNPDMKTPVIEGLVSEGLILQRHCTWHPSAPVNSSPFGVLSPQSVRAQPSRFCGCCMVPVLPFSKTAPQKLHCRNLSDCLGDHAG